MRSPRQNPSQTVVVAAAAATAAATAAVAAAVATAEAAICVSSHKAATHAKQGAGEGKVQKKKKEKCNTISFYARNKDWTGTGVKNSNRAVRLNSRRRYKAAGGQAGRQHNIFMVKNFKFPLELRSAFLGEVAPSSPFALEISWHEMK